MQYDTSAKVLTYKGGLQVTFEPFYLYNSTAQTWAASTTLFRPIQIKDTNGNYINIAYVTNSEQSINTITDTLGRVISFGYDANQHLTSITWNGQSWAFVWNNTYTLNYNYSVGVLDSPATGSQIPVIIGVGFPPPPGYTGGAAYLFTYGDWGIVNQIANYSAGGALRSSVAYNYQNASSALSDFPTYTTQTLFDGVLTSAYTYQLTGSSSNPVPSPSPTPAHPRHRCRPRKRS
jgi:YD repeat-containing protein